MWLYWPFVTEVLWDVIYLGKHDSAAISLSVFASANRKAQGWEFADASGDVRYQSATKGQRTQVVVKQANNKEKN